MAVFRIEKTRDYTVMSNYHLRDRSLSLKAKGLLSLMLSLPEDWDYPGTAGGGKAGVREAAAQACPGEEAPGAGEAVSRGVKWRLEWAFFLGENGRRQYNRLCKGCVHPCKQSFRAVVLDCPHFQSQRVKKGVDKGGKRAK